MKWDALKFIFSAWPVSPFFTRFVYCELQNAALRDIAHVADTLSTHGMDDQQIQSVARIRYMAHECLRDHIGSSPLGMSNSQNDIEKRGRGKERVRRRGNAITKRKRNDELEDYYTPNMHNQSRFYPSAAAVSDQAQLYHVDDEVHLYHISSPIVDEVKFEHGVEEVDEDQLSHESEESPDANIDIIQQSTLETSVQNEFTVTA